MVKKRYVNFSSSYLYKPTVIGLQILNFFLIPVNQVIAEGNEHGSHVSSFNEGREGELQVRGPSVFKWLVSISA